MDGQTMIWFVTSYDEVEQILRDDKHFVREARHALPPEQVYEPNPLEAMISDHMLILLANLLRAILRDETYNQAAKTGGRKCP